MSRQASPAGVCLLLLTSSLGCAGRSEPPGHEGLRIDGVDRCDYAVDVASARPLILDVSANCKGPGIRGLEADDVRVLDGIEAPSEGETPLLRQGKSFHMKRARPRASFRYRVNLERLAEHANFDLALRSGRSLIAPVSSFLLYPLPLDVGIEIDLRVTSKAGFDFITGLTRTSSGYRLEGHEIPVATYAAFGAKLTREVSVDRGQATIDLVLLDGELSLPLEALAAWVRERARVVTEFYGAFPAPRTLIAVVPIPNHDQVEFGKLLPESAPGVVLSLGSRALAESLYRDWVLLHELLHLGVPSFYREGKWFDEGLATYFEPILRVRAGLSDELSLWNEFVRDMPQGLGTLTRHGLEHAQSSAGVYWGGAIYCLLADIEARTRSAGAVGLEDAVRRVFDAGGRAWEVWDLSRVITLGDKAFASPILEPLRARYAQAPAAVNLEATFHALGVVRQRHGIKLREDAPLSWVRHAIVQGTRH